MLLDVPVRAIEEDYRLSQSELEPEREEKVREIRSIGLPDDFADCPTDWVQTVCAFVEERYGGVQKYLLHCGVTEVQQDSIKRIVEWR